MTHIVVEWAEADRHIAWLRDLAKDVEAGGQIPGHAQRLVAEIIRAHALKVERIEAERRAKFYEGRAA